MAKQDDDERLRLAREAYARRDWATSHALLEELRQERPLSGEDLTALGDAAWWLGLIRQTLEVSEECHRRFLEEGRLDRAAVVAFENGFNWFLRGEPEIGSGWISRGRRIAEDLPEGPAHGHLLWLESNERANTGDVEGALECSRRLQELGRRVGDTDLVALGLANEARLLVDAGQVARGLELMDEAMLPVLAGEVTAAAAGNLYCQMMSLCDDLADVARARRWTRVTEQWCDGFTSAVMFVGICRVHRTQLLRLAGDWEGAREQAVAAATELAELNTEAVAEAHYELGEIHRVGADYDAARASYDEAAARGRRPEPGASLLLLAEGRTAEAATSILQALAEESRPFRRARLLAAQAEIACAGGDAETATQAADALQDLARTWPSPGFRTWAARARGAGLVCVGAPAEALAPLRTALAGFEQVEARYDAACTRLLLGKALAALDDPAGSAEIAAATAALDTLGTAPQPRHGLTPRELEILALVAEGLTNREVAGRLVISEKTVARHLANVFLKLDVTSRTAAASWAHREGLVPT